MLPSPDMMQTCAPNVAPQTLAAIIQVESGGNPYALGVNGPVKRLPHPTSTQEAARQARYYMNLGYSVDLGLMQINSNNLHSSGYTVETILDPCNNLRAGSRILSRGYAGAIKQYGPGQDALKAALSAYNTGNYERGFQNGYVAKYYRSHRAQIVVRSPISAPAAAIAKHIPSKPTLPVDPLAQNPYFADTTVYKRTIPVRVFNEGAPPLRQNGTPQVWQAFSEKPFWLPRAIYFGHDDTTPPIQIQPKPQELVYE